MLSLKEAKVLAKQKLSEKRYRHVKNVARAAYELALQHGADTQKAQLAAWLHDIVKEASAEELLQLLQRDAIMAGATKRRPLPIWHGPCAAIYAKHELGIDDEEVLTALACHTTGKTNMTLLDKVLFMADVISAERTFSGVEALRQLAFEDLDEAVLAAMEKNIAHIQKVGKPLDAETLAAREYLLKQKNQQQRTSNGGTPI